MDKNYKEGHRSLTSMDRKSPKTRLGETRKSCRPAKSRGGAKAVQDYNPVTSTVCTPDKDINALGYGWVRRRCLGAGTTYTPCPAAAHAHLSAQTGYTNSRLCVGQTMFPPHKKRTTTTIIIMLVGACCSAESASSRWWWWHKNIAWAPFPRGGSSAQARGVDCLIRYHVLYLTMPSMPETALCMSTSLSNSFRARSALERLGGLMILIATGLSLARCRPDNHETM